MQRNSPWYKNYDYWYSTAMKFMASADYDSLSPEQKNEIISYGKFSIIKLVFESNTIEGAGTKTFGETVRIFRDYCKKVWRENKNRRLYAFARRGTFFSIW